MSEKRKYYRIKYISVMVPAYAVVDENGDITTNILLSKDIYQTQSAAQARVDSLNKEQGNVYDE